MQQGDLRGLPRSIDDTEGMHVPQGLPRVIDAHVHVFPDRLFRTVRDWFDRFAWDIRYRMDSEGLIRFLLTRGVGHVVALQYAHRPGIARGLNEYMAGLCRGFPSLVTGTATVFPGEDGCESILMDAFAMGLKGVKLHPHVQCFDLNGTEAGTVYETCASQGMPLVMHAGREPSSPAYLCDPRLQCGAQRLERVLRDHPGLRVCVPHLGADEIQEYRDLCERYDNLWLDTSMLLAGYFPFSLPCRLDEFRHDRIMYGSDFPNIPYAWDRELKRIEASNLPEAFLELLLEGNASEFFGISTMP